MPVVKTFRTIERSENWSVIFFQPVLLTIITKDGIIHLSGMYRQIRFTGGLHELSINHGSY